jgi:hypothetical protein
MRELIEKGSDEVEQMGLKHHHLFFIHPQFHDSPYLIRYNFYKLCKRGGYGGEYYFGYWKG